MLPPATMLPIYSRFLVNVLLVTGLLTTTIMTQRVQASPASQGVEAQKKLTTLMKNYAACWHFNDLHCLMELHVRSAPVLLTGPGSDERATTLKDIETLYGNWLKVLNADQPVGVTVKNAVFISGPEDDSGIASADLVFKGSTTEKSPLALKGPLRVQLYTVNRHGLWLVRSASLSLPLPLGQACPPCTATTPSTESTKATAATPAEPTKTPPVKPAAPKPQTSGS